MKRVTTLIVGLLAVLAGCGPQVLDTSSLQALEVSLEALREPMEMKDRDQFDESLGYLVGEAAYLIGSPIPGHSELVLQMYRPLAGRTADGIMAEARRRRFAEVRSAITKMEEGRIASEEARAELASFRLAAGRVYKRNRGSLEWPLIEFKAENQTEHVVWLIHFRAALLKPEDEEPWLEEEFDHVVINGLDPGVRDLWRIEPERQEWIHLIDPHPDLEFTLEVMRLEAFRGRVVAAADWGEIEAHRLALYRKTLGLLRTTGTLVLDSPPRAGDRAKEPVSESPDRG